MNQLSNRRRMPFHSGLRAADFASGQVSFLALYPFDTRVIARFPPRSVVFRLAALLNDDRLSVGPSESREVTVEFEPDALDEIFVDSPNATWSSLKATLPPDWFVEALSVQDTPPGVRFVNLKACLRLFDGGIVILAIEVDYDVDIRSADMPTLIKQVLDPIRHVNVALTETCRSILATFGNSFRSAVVASRRSARINSRYELYVDRIRVTSVPELYPTVITKVWSRQPLVADAFDIRDTDLVQAMYLDRSEMSNALPSFEEDFIAVGYDCVWWVLAPNFEERTDRFRERIELTFQYVLSISMSVYVTDQEIDQELSEIGRVRWHRGGDGEALTRHVIAVRRIRGEVTDLLKDLAPESFSTWLSDVFLVRRIIKRWLVNESSRALKDKMNTANLILRELHESVIEHEQRELTIVGTIFAAASVGSLVLAAVTLLFTQTGWETTNGHVATALLIAKIALVLYLGTLPFWVLLALVRRWTPRILRVIGGIADEQGGPRSGWHTGR